MTKRAQLADGTILEFPADTPDEVMDKVVRQHISGGAPEAPQAQEQPATPADGIPNPAAPTWTPEAAQEQPADPNAVLTDLWRSGADNNAIMAKAGELGLRITDTSRLDAMREYEKANPGYYKTAAPFVKGPGSGMERVDQQQAANGPLEEIGAIGGAAFRGIAALPDMLLDARDAIFPNLKTDGSRFSDIPDMLGTKRPNSAGVEFAANVLGGMAVPMPKAPTQPVNALAKAGAPAEAQTANALADPRAIVEAGKREGVRVMTSDVKPPRTVGGQAARRFGEIIPIAGTAGPRASQQVERTEAVRKMVNEFGDGVSFEEAGKFVADDFAATRGAAVQANTKAKLSVIEGIPGVAPATKTLKAIDDKIAELEARASPTSIEAAAELKKLRPSFEGKTLAQLEAMRADELGAYFKGESLARIRDVGEKAMKSIYGPLKEDMGAFIKAKGGEGQFIKWKNANARLSSMAGELDVSSFKAALNKAETTPEAAAKLIFSKTPSEVRRLHRNLSPAGRAKAQAAIVLKVAEDATTDGVISPDRFKNGIEALDKATGIFFSPADKARIDGMTRLLHATKRGAEASVNPATGVQNTPFIAGVSLSQIFGAAAVPVAGGYGVMARLYESAAVRDALLRIGRTKPGSPQEKIATAGAEKIIARYLAKSAPVAADRIERAATMSPGRAAAQDEQN